MRLRKFIHGEWVLIIAGLVSIVFGVFVLAFPSAGALALVWLIGFYAIFSASCWSRSRPRKELSE